jgi:phospholipase/carboxylesterase
MNSFNRVNQIIQQEITNGVDPEKIIVFGFSQGGCLALASALLLEKKIGGFAANGSFLPFWESSIEELFAKAKNVNKETPILICHGEGDSFVPY